MKKHVSIIIGLLLGLVILTLVLPEPHKPVEVAAIPAPAAAVVDDREVLLETTVHIMDVCGAKLSPARGAILAQQIVRVLMDRTGNQAQREAFVSLLCIESKFDTAAKSPVGATGVAQVMPALAQNFADICSLGQLSPNDINDVEVNLQLGSCLFFSLLERFNGNVALALSAYNSGADSKTTKAVSNLGTGHVETGWYIAKYFTLQEKLRLQNNPAVVEVKQ